MEHHCVKSSFLCWQNIIRNGVDRSVSQFVPYLTILENNENISPYWRQGQTLWWQTFSWCLKLLNKSHITTAWTITMTMTIERQVGAACLGPKVLPSPAPGVILIEVSRNWITTKVSRNIIIWFLEIESTVNFKLMISLLPYYSTDKTNHGDVLIHPSWMNIMMAIIDIWSKAVHDGSFEDDFGDLGLSASQVSLPS